MMVNPNQGTARNTMAMTSATQTPLIGDRSAELLREHQQLIWTRTDRLFAGLLAFEWVAAICVVLINSLRSFTGPVSTIHSEVLNATCLGAAIVVLPVALAVLMPGRAITRQLIAIAQLCMSGLLIHVGQGRIEIQFHVFGSLAFLAFYRDWRVLVTASLVVCIDQLFRGLILPQSIYGTDQAAAWRMLEYVGWMVFEDVFLIASCIQSVREMRGIAENRARREESHQRIEGIIEQRTSELRLLAWQDRLTGLANRARLNGRLQEAVARAVGEPGYRFAVLYLDFDRFKVINDSLGHATGDRLLQAIAARLSEALAGAGGTLGEPMAARLGGDEFVILIDQLSGAVAAGRFAERLLEDLSTPYTIDGRDIHSTASIGLTTSDLPGRSAEEVLRDADIAMYHAKAAGRARCAHFDRRMHDDVRTRLELENDLRCAIERGQMQLYYQPIVSLVDHHVYGFEALVRWNHPRHGVVSPADFIPCCEELGLIVPLGMWILREACRQLKEWHLKFPHHPDLTISVNVSARQLPTHDLVEQIDAVLKEHQLPPQCLALEITESVVIADAEAAVCILEQIRDLGVRLHMDDFGTGYSSLSMLHQMPLHGLKIDRKFMQNVSEHRDYAAVVHAIVTLARNLNMKLIAEGIEDADQVALLQAMDCDLAQGYFFAPPRDAAGAEAYLANPASGVAA
jgi:diguanylate cyclase (GGDEF)-like protein